MRLLVTAGLCFLGSLPAAAQSTRSGTIVGTVSRDSSGVVVGRAEVQLPQLNLITTTNAIGAFQFANVPPGRYAITVRAIGFQPLLDSLDVKPGARLDADIILTAEPVSLATQHTTAAAVEKQLPIGLQEMAERMKTHLGGYFLTDSVLRANDDKPLASLLAQAVGVTLVYSTTGNGIFLATERGRGDGGPVMTDEHHSDGTFPAGRCYINVFVDGNPYFLGPASPTNPPPDFNELEAHEYSGIEYYSSGSIMPAEYNGSKAVCGALLLWTRRTQ